jgi:YggT family protein
MVMDVTYRMTEPLYRRIRAILPSMGGLDLSPMVVLLGIIFLQSLLSQAARNMMM